MIVQNEFKVKLNELIKVNSIEKTSDYYDDYPEKLKYESQYKVSGKVMNYINFEINPKHHLQTAWLEM